jgi:hypothetical protein
MHAFVSAPPLLFATKTPSANVTDLGCEYVLDIDATGAGTVRVLTGKVSLETGKGKVVVALQKTWARLLPGRHVGVLLAASASPELVAATHEYEDHPSAATIARLLELTTRGDAITLANLADIAPEHLRPVLERLMQLVPAPQDVTVDQAIAEPAFLDMWLGEVTLVHLGASKVPDHR